MQKQYINTTEGSRDRLFHECRDLRKCQGAITSLFKSRGYSEVVTPEVEYYDLFTQSGNPLPQESMLKIIDRSGKICVMRPDCTTPIARVAATKLSSRPFPQRLYYNETIFRSDAAHVGYENEIAQCGIELIGAPGMKGDAEVIAMAVDSLEACGLQQFHIELGHSGLFSALTKDLDADADAISEMRRCIDAKNYVGLSALIDTLPPQPGLEAVRRLPILFGEGGVLDVAEEMTGSCEAREIINYLRELYDVLDASGRGHRIRFDLGRVSKLDYYTGVVFSGYAQGVGRKVLAGGRYDTLLGYFGKDRPATGFAVYVDDLAACLPHAVLPAVDTVIHFELSCLKEAVDLLDELPGGTAELSPYETVEGSMDLAKEKQVSRLIILTQGGRREVTL